MRSKDNARILAALLAALALPTTGSGQVRQIIDASGDGSGGTLDGAGFVAVDAGGNVFVTGVDSSNAFKISSSGVVSEIIDSTGDGVGNALVDSNGMALDGAGNVYLAGDASDNAFKIEDPCGANTITEIIDSTGDGGGNSHSGTIGVAVDVAGNVYVTGDNTHNAFKIEDPCGTPTITEIIDSGGDGTNAMLTPQFLAVDSSGSVYLTASGTNNVFMITSPGQPAQTITQIMDSSGDGTNGLNDPAGIAVDAAQNVYVVGLVSNNVFKVSNPGQPSQTIVQVMDSSGDGAGNALSAPIGVTVDAAGSVYVTGFASDNAFKIEDPCGANTITEIIDANGDGCHGLDGAAGIAVDGAGNVYVAGNESDNAFKVGPAQRIGTNYCLSGVNSTGRSASISATGSAVAADQDLTLSATCCPDNAPGLFYFGPNQLNGAPFGDGFRCVGVPSSRRMYPFAVAGPMNGNPAGVANLTANFNAPYASSITSGADLNFQFWYRDGMAMMSGFNLTQGLNVVFQ